MFVCVIRNKNSSLSSTRGRGQKRNVQSYNSHPFYWTKEDCYHFLNQEVPIWASLKSNDEIGQSSELFCYGEVQNWWNKVPASPPQDASWDRLPPSCHPNRNWSFIPPIESKPFKKENCRNTINYIHLRPNMSGMRKIKIRKKEKCTLN